MNFNVLNFGLLALKSYFQTVLNRTA